MKRRLTRKPPGKRREQHHRKLDSPFGNVIPVTLMRQVCGDSWLLMSADRAS